MHKTSAVIRKKGNQYCVFSKDGKNLGCSDTHEGAKKRLREVEFFKHKGSSSMNYDKAFNNFAKALSDDFQPEDIGKEPGSKPRQVEVESETLSVADRLKTGTVAGYPSELLLDKKDHFPVITQTQAQSSMARVMQLSDAPNWYRGTLAELRKEVYDGIMSMHPDIQLNIKVPAEVAVALSDGEESASTSKTGVQDPNDDLRHDHVPSVKRPTLSSAQVEQALSDEDNRRAVAGRLMEMVDEQMKQLKSAKDLAGRLIKSGLKAEEFDKLSTYLQQDIMRELMHKQSVEASTNRRRELLDRMKNG